MSYNIYSDGVLMWNSANVICLATVGIKIHSMTKKHFAFLKQLPQKISVH